MAMTTARSDMISNLPDAVLCHILSFLQTKLAAATSILSKRWIRLWLSVPALHLVEKSHGELDLNQSIQFLRMAYAIMLKTDMTHIKTFSLKFCGHTLCDASDVSAWINAAIHRGIESLHLDLLPSISLPSGIIGSKTLVYISLFHLTINGAFGDGFPSLKAMDLMSVHFERHRDLMHLLSGCPILEDLNAERLTLSNDELISVEEFQSILHNLVLVDVSFAATYIPFRCLCNAKSLSLMEWLPNYEVAFTFHNLTSLELMVGFYNWHWFFKLLHRCPKLQSLKIVKLEGDDDDDFVDERWVQPQFVPGCLSSHLRTCDLENYEGFDSELLQFAKYIMQNAKVLCNMRISGCIFSNQQAKLNFIKELSSFPWSSSELYLNVM